MIALCLMPLLKVSLQHIIILSEQASLNCTNRKRDYLKSTKHFIQKTISTELQIVSIYKQVKVHAKADT